MTGEGEGLRSRRFFGSQFLEGGGSHPQDQGNRGQGLDVVDHRRLTPQTFLRREGRLGQRHSPIPFDGAHQGRLFAAHEGAGALHHVNPTGIGGSKDVIP